MQNVQLALIIFLCRSVTNFPAILCFFSSTIFAMWKSLSIIYGQHKSWRRTLFFIICLLFCVSALRYEALHARVLASLSRSHIYGSTRCFPLSILRFFYILLVLFTWTNAAQKRVATLIKPFYLFNKGKRRILSSKWMCHLVKTTRESVWAIFFSDNNRGQKKKKWQVG